MSLLSKSEQLIKLQSRFRNLNEISLKIQGLLESDNLPQEILQVLKSEIDADGVQYWSLPPSKMSARLEAIVTSDQSLAELGHQLTPQDPILAYVFQTKKNLILEQIPSEVKTTSPIVSEGTQSLMAVPAVRDGELLGILIIESRTEGHFDEIDVTFFEAVSQQIVALITNQQMVFDLRSFSKKLQTAVQEKTMELRRAHERVLESQKNLQKENKVLKTLVDQDRREQDFIGASPAIKAVLAMVEKVAPTSATVLILGESGTGKELIARQIHFNSDHAGAPFITVNCAALQESLLESELFGHEKGSFTGAINQKIGLCEAADGGTLFLDEIGEMSLGIQTKLLRFIQEGEFYRIGGKRPIQVNVRILSATNRDLQEEVKTGRFREDLYYRLNTISLKLPPLRARREDIPSLCEYYLKNSKFGGVSHVKRIDSRVIEVFQNYPWPGNIRELQNTMERLKILVEGPEIRLDDIPVAMRLPKETAHLSQFHIETPLEEVEKSHILRSLAFNQGNKTKTALSLGITIKTLYNKLHRYGVFASNEETPTSNLNH